VSRAPRSSFALENHHRSGGPARFPLVPIAAIGDHLAEGAIAVNARRVVTYVNRIATAILGVRADALIGRDVLAIASPSQRDTSSQFARALAEVLERGVEHVLSLTDVDATRSFNVDYCRLLPIADGGALILLGESMSPSVSERLSGAQSLAEILQRINQSLEVERVLTLLATHSAQLVGGNGATVMMLEDYELVAAAGAGSERNAIGNRYSLNESFAGEVVRSRRARRTDDLRVDPDDITHGEVSHARVSAIAAPLQIADRPIGALMVVGFPGQRFSDHHEQLLVTLATHGAIALENARLYRAAAQTARHADVAARVARVALSSTSLSDAANSILSVVSDVVPMGGAAIGLLHRDDAITYIGAIGNARTAVGSRIPLGASIARAVVAKATSADVASTQREPATDASLAAGGVVLALAAKDRVLGVLAVAALPGTLLPQQSIDALRRLAPSIALAIDVQLLGEVERHRHARERMLATALATMDQPVFVLSLDRRVLYANDAAVREYGYTHDELTTMTVDVLVASAVPLRATDDFSRTPANVVVAEHVHRRRDGSHFPASVALSFIRQDNGTPIGQVLNVRNLTDERRIAEQLRQSEKLAALGELVAGVAHELNNPLAGISAFAQLLLEEELNADQRESARLIKREADRAVGVIRDLLLFSRKAGPSTMPVDINGLVQLTLRLRAYSLRSSGVQVETYLDTMLPEVAGDDQKLQQVILNLIVNAEYAMRRTATKHLVIRTAHEGDSVITEVSDSGTGMSEDTLQRVFEPFFTTKPAGEGTGLGLSVSYGIIEAHGGTITVESLTGRGTTFRIVLPVANPRDEPRGRPG
jgi:PAS domain S-box-containing protein